MRRSVDDHGTGVVYGANFSIGANLFMSISSYAAKLFSRFEEDDPCVFEFPGILGGDADA